MAYARRSRTRRAPARGRARSSARRTVTRRSTRRTTAKRTTRRASAPRQSVVRLEIVQRPMDANPIADALAASKKEVKPKRARL